MASRTPGLWRRANHAENTIQRVLGNQAALQLIKKSSPAGGRLEIGRPGSLYELEADRAAESIMHMPERSLQRRRVGGGSGSACAEGQVKQRALIAPRAEGSSLPAEAPPIVHAVLRGTGEPLEGATRTFFESHFERDFSQVRIHTGPEAAVGARAVRAAAFTVGNHIVFGSNRYSPGTGEGRRLLAHELTHVTQQNGIPLRLDREPEDSSHAPEVEEAINRKDPVGGTGNPEDALKILRGLSTGSLLLTLRDLRDHFQLPWLKTYVTSADFRVGAAIHVVELQGLAPGALLPEGLAELREEVLQLPQADRDAITRFFPSAQVPAAPALPAGGLTAPASSPHATLPKPLLEALWISYSRRLAGMPGSRKNLDNAFWGSYPKDFWDALDRLARGGVLPIIQEIYSRWTASGIPWTALQDVREAWGGGSLGFNFNAIDVAPFQKQLESSSSYCRDVELLGGLYHYWHNETPCWHEVVSCARGLHFCLGSTPPSVHIDPTQVIEKREADGSCNYDMDCVYGHFKDLGWVP